MNLGFLTCFVWSIFLLELLSGGVIRPSNLAEESLRVKLRGEVTDLHLLEEDQHTVRWELRLKLKLVNESDKSAILLRQDFRIGGVMLARNQPCASDAKYIYRSAAWPSVYSGPEWGRWRQHLDSAAPEPNQTWILAPRQSISFEARTALNIEKAGNFDRTNEPWDEIRKSTKCLQVQIQTWPANIEPRHDPENPEFGQTLRRHWKSFGELQLDLLTSEPIQLEFPQR